MYGSNFYESDVTQVGQIIPTSQPCPREEIDLLAPSLCKEFIVMRQNAGHSNMHSNM